jgi:hypothetical protein
VAQTLLDTLALPDSGEGLIVFSLLALGELGKTVDLHGLSALLPTLFTAFAAPSEEIKSCAAVALGGIAVGNLAMFLPVIVGDMAAQPPARQYLLLHSLKEVIVALSVSVDTVAILAPFVVCVVFFLFCFFFF